MGTSQPPIGDPKDLPDAEVLWGFPAGRPPPHVVARGCVLPRHPQDRIAQINGTKVGQGYDEEDEQVWVDVEDGAGQVWHIRWDASPMQ